MLSSFVSDRRFECDKFQETSFTFALVLASQGKRGLRVCLRACLEQPKLTLSLQTNISSSATS
jgi:hypothetical protein